MFPPVEIMPRNPAKRLDVVFAPMKPTPTRGHSPRKVPIGFLTRPVEHVYIAKLAAPEALAKVEPTLPKDILVPPPPREVLEL